MNIVTVRFYRRGASMGTIEERLAKLERTARRWRLAALGLAGCVVCVVGMGADGDSDSKDVIFKGAIQTTALTIIDKDGNPRALIGYPSDKDEMTFLLVGRDGNSGTVMWPGVERIKVTKADGTVKYIE